MFKTSDRNADRKARHARVRKKISGTPEMPRLCVYRSLNNIYAQIIDDTTGKTLTASSSAALKLENGGNIDAAKKVGEDIAKKCLEMNLESVKFDRGGYVYHGRVQALADAAREAGLKF